MGSKTVARRTAAALIGLAAMGGVATLAWALYDTGTQTADLSKYEIVNDTRPPRPPRQPKQAAGGIPPAARPPSAETLLLQQAKSGDQAQRAQATGRLKLLYQSSPDRLAAELPQWLSPLMEAQMYDEVLDLTNRAFVIHATNSASISDFAEARVKALVALGRAGEAGPDAKRAFNVATQKVLPRVLGVISGALAGSPGATLSADELTARLKSIDAKGDAFATAVRDLGAPSTYPELIALGTMHLLNDRPQEALAAFTAAAELPTTKGKNLALALDGIVRAYRASTCSAARANGLAAAFRANNANYPDYAVIPIAKLPPKEVQSARSKIAVADLPK